LLSVFMFFPNYDHISQYFSFLWLNAVEEAHCWKSTNYDVRKEHDNDVDLLRSTLPF
jgi:hypothetical protein